MEVHNVTAKDPFGRKKREAQKYPGLNKGTQDGGTKNSLTFALFFFLDYFSF